LNNLEAWIQDYFKNVACATNEIHGMNKKPAVDRSINEMDALAIRYVCTSTGMNKIK